MSNSTSPLKGACFSGPNWQGMLLMILFGMTSLLAHADATTDELLRRHNEARAQNGRAALCMNAQLNTAAQRHCQDMISNGFFDHTGSGGTDPGDRIRSAGYNWRTYGENIAWGQQNPDQAMGDWLNSSGHRANILNSAFKEVGFAKCGSQYSPYWVADFATSSSGSTNCTTAAATGGSTTGGTTTGGATTGGTPSGGTTAGGTTTGNTNTSLAAAKKAGLATLNECKKHADWYYKPNIDRWQIFYQGACFRYDDNNGRMWKLVLGKDAVYRFSYLGVY